jgi:hypothetical protein
MALTSGLSARPHPSKTINAVFFIVSFGATNLRIIGAKKDPLVAGLNDIFYGLIHGNPSILSDGSRFISCTDGSSKIIVLA